MIGVIDRLRAAGSQLAELLATPEPKAAIRTFPAPRNLLLDVLAKGHRKNTFHIVFDADISVAKECLNKLRRENRRPVSITSYIAKAFAGAIAADKRMQAYRLGRSQLIIFDEVDIGFTIEREWEGERLPVFYIVRDANSKSVEQINEELHRAKRAPLGEDGPMSALELQLSLLPRFMRGLVWWYIGRDPHRLKGVAGTVGLTSYGMHTSGAAVGMPITPMSFTLTVGAIEKKLMRVNEQVVERDFVHMCISMDHDVIDGAPSMRFIDRFKIMLQDGTVLLSGSADN